jgi:hypothetical protein
MAQIGGVAEPDPADAFEPLRSAMALPNTAYHTTLEANATTAATTIVKKFIPRFL